MNSRQQDTLVRIALPVLLLIMATQCARGGTWQRTFTWVEEETGTWTDDDNWLQTGGDYDPSRPQRPGIYDKAYVSNGGNCNTGNLYARADILNIAIGAGLFGTVTTSESTCQTTVNGFFRLGASSGQGQGTYQLSAGKLTNAASAEIRKTGYFHQTGGMHECTSSSNSLQLRGTYDLSGGNLEINLVHVRGEPSDGGEFNHSKGTVAAAGVLMGWGTSTAADEGSYNLSGTGQLSADDIWVGYNGYSSARKGKGWFTQTGGVCEAIALSVGYHTDAEGTYEMTGNSTCTVSSELRLGYLTDTNGTFNLKGGTLSASREYVAYAGTGTLTQTGGTNTVQTDLEIGFGSHHRQRERGEGGVRDKRGEPGRKQRRKDRRRSDHQQY